MFIRMTKLMAGPAGVFQVGAVRDVEKKLAEQLFKDHAAVEMTAQEVAAHKAALAKKDPAADGVDAPEFEARAPWQTAGDEAYRKAVDAGKSNEEAQREAIAVVAKIPGSPYFEAAQKRAAEGKGDKKDDKVDDKK